MFKFVITSEGNDRSVKVDAEISGGGNASRPHGSSLFFSFRHSEIY